MFINFKYIKRNAGLLLTLLLSLFFLCYYYGPVLISPNSYLCSIHGDGLKNYYTFVYHVKHDLSLNHFSGMLYPFGDLHLFSDGHSVLAWPLQLLSRWWPGIADYSVGILNSLILWSCLITSVLLYQILRHYKLPQLYSACFAVALMIMAPQWDRIYGHFSLAYSFFIPFVWYLMLKYNENGKSKYTWGLSLFLLVLYFLHPYLGVISTLFILVHQGFVYLFKKELRTPKFIFTTLFSSVIGLVIFQVYVIVLDQEIDRPLNKFLYGKYFAEFQSVFFPHFEPFGSHVRDLLRIKNQTWEAWSYIGMFSLLTLVVALIRTLVLMIKRRFKITVNEPTVLAFWSGSLILLIAIGVPFKYTGDAILDLVHPIRQIRVMSRFSWVFFFVTGVFSASYVYRLIVRQNSKYQKVLLSSVMILLAGLTIVESFQLHQKAELIVNSPNLFQVDRLDADLQSAIAEVDPTEFQAMLSLPFFEIGTERLSSYIKNRAAFNNSLVLSYHLGLPLINSCMSRTSESKAEMVMELLNELYEPSKLLEVVDKDKPVLVYQDKKDTSYSDELIVSKLPASFHSAVTFELKKIIPREMLKNEQQVITAAYLEGKDSLFRRGNTFCTDANALVYFQPFDSLGNDSTLYFTGQKSLKSKHNGFTQLWEVPAGKLQADIEYFISFWYFSKPGTAASTIFFIEEQSNEGQYEWTNVADTRYGLKTIGDWTYLKLPFTPKYANSKHKFILHSECRLDPDLLVDQLLIWEKSTTVYMEYDGKLFKNNYPVSSLNDIYREKD